MNCNHNHPQPNVNPNDPNNERGSILKPLLLAVALLTVTVSLTYAMVVTQSSTNATTAPSSPTPQNGHDASDHKITLTRNPCATGDNIGILIARSANDKNLKVYVGNVQVTRGTPANRAWFGIFTAPNTGGNFLVRVIDGGKVAATATLTVVQLTGIYIFKDPVKSEWHQIIKKSGKDNYVALKSPLKGDEVVYKATIKPNTPATRKFTHDNIVWDNAAKSTDLKGRVKADEVAGPAAVKATLGNASQIKTNWIFWADLTVRVTGLLNSKNHSAILDNGNWPTPNSASYLYVGLGGGANLGAIDCLSNSDLTYAYAIGKMEAVAVLQPSDIVKIIPSGWTIIRKMEGYTWNNALPVDTAPPPGKWDRINPITRHFDSVHGQVFGLDVPGCPVIGSGTSVDHTAEVYLNFYEYAAVDYGGVLVICSDAKKWSYLAQVDGDAGVVRGNVLSLSHINLKLHNRPFYKKR
jgi:hypothetical protein